MSNKLKMAVISGASEALKFKNSHANATDDKVMEHVAKNAEEIAEKIDELDDAF